MSTRILDICPFLSGLPGEEDATRAVVASLEALGHRCQLPVHLSERNWEMRAQIRLGPDSLLVCTGEKGLFCVNTLQKSIKEHKTKVLWTHHTEPSGKFKTTMGLPDFVALPQHTRIKGVHFDMKPGQELIFTRGVPTSFQPEKAGRLYAANQSSAPEFCRIDLQRPFLVLSLPSSLADGTGPDRGQMQAYFDYYVQLKAEFPDHRGVIVENPKTPRSLAIQFKTWLVQHGVEGHVLFREDRTGYETLLAAAAFHKNSRIVASNSISSGTLFQKLSERAENKTIVIFSHSAPGQVAFARYMNREGFCGLMDLSNRSLIKPYRPVSFHPARYPENDLARSVDYTLNRGLQKNNVVPFVLTV